jgi:hypothetical protein
MTHGRLASLRVQPTNLRCERVVPMKLRVLLAGFLLVITLVQPSHAMKRIAEDMGGPLGEYLLMFVAIRDSGERVMIDGRCFSACTLVTALVPRERICITERAMLGFHAGWFQNKDGERVISATGTGVLLEMYPPVIRNWIARQGGLGERTIVLGGRELAAIYRSCR